jgi:ATP-dependent DNA ligase
LRLNGSDLRLRPIEKRRSALLRLVVGVNGILFSETLAAEGAIVFAKARELRPRWHWLKTKNPDFVRTSPMPRGGPVTCPSSGDDTGA